jgi:hypothetical protein
MPATTTSVDGNSLTSDGSHRVNPSDRTAFGLVFENLAERDGNDFVESGKCGAPLRITDLKFEDMKYPTWNEWQEIVEQRGTIDGNLVKIKRRFLTNRAKRNMPTCVLRNLQRRQMGRHAPRLAAQR